MIFLLFVVVVLSVDSALIATNSDRLSTAHASSNHIRSLLKQNVNGDNIKQTRQTPYSTARRSKKQSGPNLKNKNKLVVNSSTCRDVAYQLALQWDQAIPIPPTTLKSKTPLPHSTLDLVNIGADLATQCTQHSSGAELIRDTIDLVCHIRIETKPKITMVTLPRCLATAWLTLAALRSPSLPTPPPAASAETVLGDIVETGTWRGGMSILSLILMKKYDRDGTCSRRVGVPPRRFWAFDS
jgi:hypothetical protein